MKYEGTFYFLTSGMFFAGLFAHFAAAIVYNRIKQTNNTNLKYLFFSWVFHGCLWYLSALGHVKMDFRFFQLGFISQIISGFYLLAFTEFNSRMHIEPVKLIMFTAISTLYLFFTLRPAQEYMILDPGLRFLGALRMVQNIYGLIYYLLNFAWTYKIWKYSPPQLKKTKSRNLLFAAVVMNIIPPVLYVVNTSSQYIYGLTYYLFAIGILWEVIIIKKNPVLLNILPFRCNKLLVCKRSSGSEIFQYQWTKKTYNEKLLAPLLRATQQMSINELKAGDLDQMDLSDGVIIFSHSEEYSVSLFVNKISRLLTNSLQAFSKEFNALKDKNEGNILELVKIHFANIPNWLE